MFIPNATNQWQQNPLIKQTNYNPNLAVNNNVGSTQEDFFKQQKALQEATQQVEQRGYADPEYAREVNIQSIKDALNQEKENTSSNTSGDSGTSSEDVTSTLSSGSLALMSNLQGKVKTSSEEKPKEQTNFTQKSKQQVIQSLQNDMESNKPIIKSSATKPEVENNDSYFNPLEVKEGKQQDKNSVSFIDEVSGRQVAVSLTDENIKRLEEKFGNLEAATDYVKGWYYDAAYSVGYLQTDTNSDGVVSLEEAQKLKAFVSLDSAKYSSISDIIPDEAAQKNFLETFGFTNNITDFINGSIEQDTDLDGILGVRELLSEEDNVLLNVGNGFVEAFAYQRTQIKINIEVQMQFSDILLNLGTNSKEESQKPKENVESEQDKENKKLEKAREEELQKGEVILDNLLEKEVLFV